ncbi:hypothetical protein BGP81_12125 [Pseudomonas putida]|nr:hypothetical protein BGP81_12125 [Pseudomonas putida]
MPLRSLDEELDTLRQNIPNLIDDRSSANHRRLGRNPIPVADLDQHASSRRCYEPAMRMH